MQYNHISLINEMEDIYIYYNVICNKHKYIKPFIININEIAIISLNTAITHALM